MAPFNKRQIGYIQAIAGRQQHDSLLCGSYNILLRSDKQPFDPKFNDGNYGVSGQDTPQALYGGLIEGVGLSSQYKAAKSLLLHTFHLASTELGFDSRDKHNDDKLEMVDYEELKPVGYGTGNHTFLNTFTCPVEATADSGNAISGGILVNPAIKPSTVRVTEDGFLNSTHVKFRFTLPTRVTSLSAPANETQLPMGQEHYEFRWIVFRNKDPVIDGGAFISNTHANMEAIRDGKSFRNYSYDLFMGQTGRKRGLLGYTHNARLDKDKFSAATEGERYSGKRVNDAKTGFIDGGTDLTALTPTGEDLLTVDDLMTMPLNRDDYTVMKDVRFFLGKEHGKSHFEDTLHWDWNDPIETPHPDVLSSPTLNNKNYRWKMMLIGTNNGVDTPVNLLSTVRWTTKMESG